MLRKTLVITTRHLSTLCVTPALAHSEMHKLFESLKSLSPSVLLQFGCSRERSRLQRMCSLSMGIVVTCGIVQPLSTRGRSLTSRLSKLLHSTNDRHEKFDHEPSPYHVQQPCVQIALPEHACVVLTKLKDCLSMWPHECRQCRCGKHRVYVGPTS